LRAATILTRTALKSLTKKPNQTSTELKVLRYLRLRLQAEADRVGLLVALITTAAAVVVVRVARGVQAAQVVVADQAVAKADRCSITMKGPDLGPGLFYAT